MSIRNQIIWDKGRNKYSGYIKCVGLTDEKVDTLASEALVFLIVSLSEWLKCPVTYFLVDKVNANVLAELINIYISKLVDLDLRVWSATADGLFTNVSEFEKLGCIFTGVSVAKMQTHFIHPANNLPIYVIFLCLPHVKTGKKCPL